MRHSRGLIAPLAQCVFHITATVMTTRKITLRFLIHNFLPVRFKAFQLFSYVTLPGVAQAVHISTLLSFNSLEADCVIKKFSFEIWKLKTFYTVFFLSSIQVPQSTSGHSVCAHAKDTLLSHLKL